MVEIRVGFIHVVRDGTVVRSGKRKDEGWVGKWGSFGAIGCYVLMAEDTQISDEFERVGTVH